MAKQLKYLKYLEQFPNCPPANYKEIEISAFRWVHKDGQESDFIPIGIMPPQRILDDSDRSCMFYGLSLYDTYMNALESYKHTYNSRSRTHLQIKFIEEKGNSIATVRIKNEDGIASMPNQKSGHVTFHEYENTDLAQKVIERIELFDNDGNFKS